MPKKRKKKSILAPILWIVIGILFAGYFFYNRFDIKKIIPQLKDKKIVKVSPEPKTFQEKSKTSISSSEKVTNVQEKLYIKVKLYLAELHDEYVSLKPIEKEIPRSETPLKDTLEALINFRDENYLNLIPVNTKIRRMWRKGNFVYIDFSRDFTYNSYGVAGYNIQIYQVVYTATQFQGIEGVYFYVEGNQLKYLGGEGFIIENPVKPYTSPPRFSL